MTQSKHLPMVSPSHFLDAGSSLPELRGEETHLRDYWKVLRKRQWTIVAVLLIVVTAVAVFTFTMKPVYRGTATIQINKENPQIVDFKEMFAVNMMDTDYYQTQYKTLESRLLAKKVIQSLNLADHSEFLPQPETPFRKWKASLLAFLSPAEDKEGIEDEKESLLIDSFLARLKIEPMRNSRLVKIHFKSGDPQLAPRVPNALAAAYIQHSLETRFEATQHAKEWLTIQLDDLKAKVERADGTLQAFASKHDIISLDEKENVTVQRLSELNEALTKAEAERMAKQALYQQTREINADSLTFDEAFPSILENKLIMDLKQYYVQLEAQHAKLAESYKPDYPDMIRLRQQILKVQKRIEGEVNKITTGIKNDYESSLKREALLRQAFIQQKAKTQEMKEKAIEYNILKREADANRDLYRGLLQRMKEAGVSAGIVASNIQILDQAEPRKKPFSPNKALNLLLASLFGLSIGVGLAFFLEYMDDTVKTPDEVEQLIRLPSFGVVPEISYRRRRQIGTGDFPPVETITYDDPRSILSEAYRSIRTSILLSFSEKPPKRIAVSSPNPAEGKTTTAVNTAISLCQTGAQVILIDADMRKPRIHTIFEERNNVGLSSYLSGNAPLESAIKKTDIPNLFCILSGPVPPDPSELVGSTMFKKMMDSLGERFSHIVIDCPPVLGFADSVIISTSVDGIMLVVKGDQTPRETLRRAKESLQQVNAKILGVVINRAHIQRGHYGYYHYRYNDYYGKTDAGKELPSSSPSWEDEDRNPRAESTTM